MVDRDAQRMWDERYSGAELVWSAGPNMWVREVAEGLSPGTALDLGAGEGRNALWLAEQGWRSTAVDFSAVGIDRARQLADGRLDDPARLTTVVADVVEYEASQPVDLVLVVYVHLPEQQRRRMLRHAAQAVAPGGRLLVVAHDTENLLHGHGGPQDPQVLYTAEDVVADVAGLGLEVERAERVVRRVDTPDGPRDALDVLALLTRPQH